MGTCMPTLSCPVAPPCTLVLPTGCRRRSPLLPHPPSRSRLLLPQRGSTPSGSEDPSWPPSPPSNRCGSPSKSTTSAAHPSSTGSASKRLHHHIARAIALLDSTFQLLVHSVPFLATQGIVFELASRNVSVSFFFSFQNS